jgi:hypothetical protein
MGVTHLRKFMGALVMCAVVASGTAQAQMMERTASMREPGWRQQECRFRTFDGKNTWSNEEVTKTIRCGTRRWDLDFAQAMEIAQNESGLNEFATNSSSGACGIFQHLPSYYPDRVRAIPDRFERLGRSCYNARSNILAALNMANRGGWYPWCGFTTYC